MRKLVSIIVPVYNLENIIERCLKSIIKQTYKNIEIIIINDGSTDESENIIKRYCKTDSRIIFLSKENGGQGSARNLGILKSSGEYIMFVDGDDWIELNMIEEMMKPFDKMNYDLVVCDYCKDFENQSKYFKTIERDYKDKRINLVLSANGPCFKIYKRTFFENNYFPEGIIFEDLALIPYINSLVNEYFYLEKHYYHYCLRESSTMLKKSFLKKQYDMFTALEYLSNKMNDKFEEEIEFLYIKHLLYLSYLRNLKFNLSETKRFRRDINNTINKKYPNWKRNKYFVSNSLKRKIITYLNFYGFSFLVKFLLLIRDRKR